MESKGYVEDLNCVLKTLYRIFICCLICNWICKWSSLFPMDRKSRFPVLMLTHAIPCLPTNAQCLYPVTTSLMNLDNTSQRPLPITSALQGQSDRSGNQEDAMNCEINWFPIPKLHIVRSVSEIVMGKPCRTVGSLTIKQNWWERIK